MGLGGELSWLWWCSTKWCQAKFHPKFGGCFFKSLAIGRILSIFQERQPIISEVTGQTDLNDALKSFF